MSKLPAWINANGTMNNEQPNPAVFNGRQTANVFKEPRDNVQPTTGVSKVAGGTNKTPKNQTAQVNAKIDTRDWQKVNTTGNDGKGAQDGQMPKGGKPPVPRKG